MLKYKGDGFIKGVPARDLTGEEVKQYGKARLIKSGLYSEPRKKYERKIIEPEKVEE